MDHNEDPGELEPKSNEQGGSLPTPLTRRHLTLGVREELRQKLQRHLLQRGLRNRSARPSANFGSNTTGPLAGDKEFWLQAESELRKNGCE